MTPHEFIKKHGLAKAKEILGAAPKQANFVETYPLGPRFYVSDIGCNNAVSIRDLGTLLYYFASVREIGTIGDAKRYMGSPYTAPEIKTFLAQALAEIEKCQ